ncbi:MFS transporter [Niastella yeongjuensis]|uniref:MFS transporter n=2 Tax=Niastella yeongjuensis TaxID=354355 RepID=A0A1V9E4Q7_9BACT|nr:MFS transporter [Niastella yeongjuensis]
MSLGTFIIFFQGFMVAPLLPNLAGYFQATVRHTSFIEPAYLMGYGAFTLMYPPLSERFGRYKLILFCMSVFVVLTVITGFVQTIDQMIILRFFTGIGCAGVSPTTLGWIGNKIPYERRGQALGIFFGLMAGGTALGSSAGALLASVTGWQNLFFGVAGMGVIVMSLIITNREHYIDKKLASASNHTTRRGAISMQILSEKRARKTYAFVLFNAMFHSGVFAWAGVLFYNRYHLDEKGIGLALLGYGIPGLILGPWMGKLADRYGRNKVIPIGIIIGSLTVIVLSLPIIPLWAACILVVTLSLSFDLTHPSLAAVTSTFPNKRGEATGLFAFFLFTGYGVGSLVFSLIVIIGLNKTFAVFGVVALLISILSVRVFRYEK